MSGLALAHPEWTAGLFAGFLLTVAAVAWAGRRALQRRRRLLGVDTEGERALRSGDALLLLALLGIALALLGPRIGTRTVRTPATGVDVVVLMDVSRSMDAADVAPSRLDRARRTADALLAALAPGDRAALAVFAGRGVLLTPLTPDTRALRELLPAVDTGLLLHQGSRLDAGVAAALEAFARASGRPRTVLVLSDGEDATGGETGASAAARAGARIVSVAIGSEAGGPIPADDGPLRDVHGRVVTTRRDGNRLATLAESSRGESFDADGYGDVPLARLREAVRREAALTPDGWNEREVAVARVAPLALGALILLVLELALPLARRRRLIPLLAGAALLVGAADADPAIGEGSHAEDLAAATDTGNPRDVTALARRDGDLDAGALLAIGVRRADRGELREAERAFFAAAARAPDATTGAEAYYNLGVIALERGEPERAARAFFDSLALAPDDRKARFNLEWSLRRPETPPPARPPQAPPPDPRDADRDSDGDPEAADPAPSESPQPDPSKDAADSEPRPVPALSPGEAARWLETVRDDPTRALRGALQREARPRSTRRDAPAW